MRPALPLLLVAALLPLGPLWPGRAVESRRIAVGGGVKLEPGSGCRRVAAEPTAALAVRDWADGGLFVEARGPGAARFRCVGGVRRYEVVAPRALRIVGPRRAPAGERFTLRVEALDAQGAPLELGPHAFPEWELQPPLRSDNSGRCEFPPWCDTPPAGGTHLRADGPGAATVTARFAGLSAAAAVEISGAGGQAQQGPR